MKDFKLTFTWNTLYKGEFPKKEFLEIDNKANITIEKISTFEFKVTIETLIEDQEDELEIAYSIGSLFHSITFQKSLEKLH